MNRFFKTAWILLPLAVFAWHLGPGQRLVQQNQTREHLVAATQASANGQWLDASQQFDEATLAWPDEDDARTAMRIRQANARVMAGEVVEGQEQLEEILTGLQSIDAPTADQQKLAKHARADLGQASYYAGWLMRLEGATSEEWLPEVERARQLYRLLAENEADANSGDMTFHENLEAAIRLERMDLSVLKGKRLPKNCPNPGCCNNLSQRKRKQCQSRCNNPGQKDSKGKEKKKQKSRDARKQLSKDAGLNARSGGGS